MNHVVVLDTGVLGMLTNAKASESTRECLEWFARLIEDEARFVVPEIADYEIRRELIRAGLHESLGRLNLLESEIEYAPLTTSVMHKAAEFWARARNRHRPTAPREALDGDVILAAQATLLEGNGQRAVVATTNVGHLAMFIKAQRWRDIY